MVVLMLSQRPVTWTSSELERHQTLTLDYRDLLHLHWSQPFSAWYAPPWSTSPVHEMTLPLLVDLRNFFSQIIFTAAISPKSSLMLTRFIPILSIIVPHLLLPALHSLLPALIGACGHVFVFSLTCDPWRPCSSQGMKNLRRSSSRQH